MNQQALMPLLMFLAGAGFNEVAYAIGKLQRGFSGMAGGGSGGGPAGIPQALSMLSGAMPQAHGPTDGQMAQGGDPNAMQGQQSPAAQLGPNPLQALAMLDLKRRMAEAQMGGRGMGGMA